MIFLQDIWNALWIFQFDQADQVFLLLTVLVDCLSHPVLSLHGFLGSDFLGQLSAVIQFFGTLDLLFLAMIWISQRFRFLVISTSSVYLRSVLTETKALVDV